jgi:4-hydroxy-3-methylbut-2-enyl diphosphate reductase
VKLRSYAKINLALDIRSKRPDNYHDIETIYQQVNLFDEVEIKKTDSQSIMLECNVCSINNKNNICYRAAELMMKKFDIKSGVYIGLKKKIPIGAGLSGGSSNAAAILKGINYIYGLKLDQGTLARLASEIGMDVPFHIYGGTCMGTGRGEIIQSIKPIDKYFVVIVYPGFEIHSKTAYENLDYDKIGKNNYTQKFMESYSIEDLGNDFEISILDKFPEITKVKDLLGPGAILTGSGSSVIALYSNEAEAKKYQEKALKYYNQVFLVETINKNISFANEMGICSGVKRALNGINIIEDKSELYVLGSLVHNTQIIEKLKSEKVKFISDYHEVDRGTIVISAHGVSDEVISELNKKKINVIDLTCPRVKKLHKITKNKEIEGKDIVILGDENHSEIRGVTGNLNNYCIINNIEDLNNKEFKSDVVFVSQTTEDEKKFKIIENKLKKTINSVEIFNTICTASKKRQKDAADLASKSDIMIIIGSKFSANTKRLFDICKSHCDSKHVETSDELKPEFFFDLENIGITAGASTPDWIIDSLKEDLAMMV